MRLKSLAALAVAAVTLAGLGSARAEDYPARQVKVIIAFSPSGESFFHQIDGADKTPGRVRSVTMALARKFPRWLKI